MNPSFVFPLCVTNQPLTLPPILKVEVTAVEVKGAIVHINSLFVISMVKSRLTQRLTRARKNIARRRLQATTGDKYGPSLSDTEQVTIDRPRPTPVDT